MKSIVFIDCEIDPRSGKLLDFGAVKNGSVGFHGARPSDFITYIHGTEFICGHNILAHDLKYIDEAVRSADISPENAIDTLYLSPLLYPKKPYHALLKDDKLQTEELNNPLNDALKAKELFHDEVAAFYRVPPELQSIYYLLLHRNRAFSAFFSFIDFSAPSGVCVALIRSKFAETVCQHSDLTQIVANYPVELAYCLALIHADDAYSITPPWVLRNFPAVDNVMYLMRNKPCLTGCSYCDGALNVRNALNRFFGFPSYKTYDGQPLQEKAVQAAIENKSLLAVFPTGGGKSITFQVPALMSGENAKGLTVVISPLQSLMKDQVDNLEKHDITRAVTINGLLDPIERAKSLERVENGEASILYISPESLRSPSIERLMLNRNVVRLVIDESHCFSSWGQDFRVDYLYIGDFIKSLQEKKNLSESIPVSCFTATAKQKVISDIQAYFREKLGIELELFTTKNRRKNLQFKVFKKNNDEEKYQAVRELISHKNCPSIVYVSRTRRAYDLSKRLNKDGFNSRPYHGKMEVQEKTANQEAFIEGKVDIMVATSAFGMGVDKKDVGLVVHYDISDSLENYIQEAGRAGRDASIEADCFVLYQEDDIDKHFILLNQTKLSIREIKQIWKAIKGITKFRVKVSNSALEIARMAGWDDNVFDIETRVHTAVAALEDAGYLKRGQNMPRIFASSILSKTAQEAIDKIYASQLFKETQKQQAARIIKNLFSKKSKKLTPGVDAESRVDYISDHLGIVKQDVIDIIHLLREEKILADTKVLTAFIKKGENLNRSKQIVKKFNDVEEFLLPKMTESEEMCHIKEWNEQAEDAGIAHISLQKIKTILNFWAIKNWIRRTYSRRSVNRLKVQCIQPPEKLNEKMERRHELAVFIVEYLYQKSAQEASLEAGPNHEVRMAFSVHELKDAYANSLASFGKTATLPDVEDSLYYLSKIQAIQLEGGFLVVYNRLTIERLETDNRKQYTEGDYGKLSTFYENKAQQIHIVAEYAEKMISDYKNALQFVEDYFQLNYTSFLRKYFPGSKADKLKSKISPAKFKKLFGELSTRQLEIIKDSKSPTIAVAAGPGSGKTRLLVHKLASLLLMEDVKHEHLLMLTFSRAAAAEFKQRLLTLYGKAAHFIDIKTFHSYCFDLLGRVGSIEKSETIIKTAIEKIQNNEIEPRAIVKSVLVIDEAQDMTADEFTLVKTLMDQNDGLRVVAVGDDDQNIYEWRGSDSKYFEEFVRNSASAVYEMTINYRSRSNLVDFSNAFVERIRHRIKETPITAQQSDRGELRIVRYRSDHILIPLVKDIANAPLRGSTGVLTHTNNDALKVAGMLRREGLPVNLVQSNEGFSLYNLLEVRYFLNLLQMDSDVAKIDSEQWREAKRGLNSRFKKSTCLSICENLIRQFEFNYGEKGFKSDLEIFVRESALEDFCDAQGETISVSTIHKAKGREFDRVFMLLDGVEAHTDADRRPIYVGMTRARTGLTIHLNTSLFDGISAGEPTFIDDTDSWPEPDELVVQLSHRDLYLDFFISRQHYIESLTSGDSLTLDGLCGLDAKGHPVLKFSKAFAAEIESHKAKGYAPKNARVNFVVYWKKEGVEKEFRVVLPEVVFGRS